MLVIAWLVCSGFGGFSPFSDSGGSGSGDMTEATYVTGGKIKTSTGGTGQDSSAWTGCFPYLSTGTWSCDGNTTKELRLMGAQASSATLASLAGLTETNGGIPYGTNDNTYAWLAAGASGKILIAKGAAAPQWTPYTMPAAVPTNGYGLISDGTNIVSTSAAFGTGAYAAAHDALTLAGTPETNVFSLATQALSLDAQTANYLFAGPTTGAAAAPTFRAMVNADIPTTLTPQVARIGVGQAADGTNPIASTGFSVSPTGAVTAVSYSTPQTTVPQATKYLEGSGGGADQCSLGAGGNLDGNATFLASGSVWISSLTIVPSAADSIALGSATAEWSDIFLGDGAIIKGQNDQGNLITSSATGWKFNLPIILANDETISNADDTEIAFNGTESIALDLDTGTGNEVAWKNKTTGSTSVDKMSFSALNLASTGWIQGGIKVDSDANGEDNTTMTAAGLYGTLFIATGAGTWTLPRAVLGMSACLMDSGDAHDLILDVSSGSTIRLKGTEQADGVGITNASGSTKGDFICVVAVATDKWSTMGMQGTWASQ